MILKFTSTTGEKDKRLGTAEIQQDRIGTLGRFYAATTLRTFASHFKNADETASYT
jgi:hypothetical protein